MHHNLRRMPALYLLLALISTVASVASAGDGETGGASAHILQAEIALQRDDYLAASSEYRKAAELSDNAETARQATRVAYSFGFDKDALASAPR